MSRQESRKRTQCWNGPSCYYLGQDSCRFYHPLWHYSNQQTYSHYPNNQFYQYAQFQQMSIPRNYYEYSHTMSQYQQQSYQQNHQLNSAYQNPNIQFPFSSFSLFPYNQSYTGINPYQMYNFNQPDHNNHIDLTQNNSSDQDITTRRNRMNMLMNRNNFDNDRFDMRHSFDENDENVTDSDTESQSEQDMFLYQTRHMYNSGIDLAQEQWDNEDDDEYGNHPFYWYFQKNNIFYEQDITDQQLDRYDQCPICFQHFKTQQTVKQKQYISIGEESLQTLLEIPVKQQQQKILWKEEQKQTEMNDRQVLLRINGEKDKISTQDQSYNSHDYHPSTQNKPTLQEPITSCHFFGKNWKTDFFQDLLQTQQQINERQILKWQQDNMQLLQKLIEQENRKKLAQLYCGHIYHTDCIQFWLKKNPCCAVCRKDFRDHVIYQKWDKNYKKRFDKSQSGQNSLEQDSLVFQAPILQDTLTFPNLIEEYLNSSYQFYQDNQDNYYNQDNPNNPNNPDNPYNPDNHDNHDNINQIQYHRYINQFMMGTISIKQLYQKLELQRSQQNFTENNQKMFKQNADILRWQMNQQQQSDYGLDLRDMLYEKQKQNEQYENNQDSNHDDINPEKNLEQEKDKFQQQEKYQCQQQERDQCQEQEKDQCLQWVDLRMIDS